MRRLCVIQVCILARPYFPQMPDQENAVTNFSLFDKITRVERRASDAQLQGNTVLLGSIDTQHFPGVQHISGHTVSSVRPEKTSTACRYGTRRRLVRSVRKRRLDEDGPGCGGAGRAAGIKVPDVRSGLNRVIADFRALRSSSADTIARVEAPEAAGVFADPRNDSVVRLAGDTRCEDCRNCGTGEDQVCRQCNGTCLCQQPRWAFRGPCAVDLECLPYHSNRTARIPQAGLMLQAHSANGVAPNLPGMEQEGNNVPEARTGQCYEHG